MIIVNLQSSGPVDVEDCLRYSHRDPKLILTETSIQIARDPPSVGAQIVVEQIPTDWWDRTFKKSAGISRLSSLDRCLATLWDVNGAQSRDGICRNTFSHFELSIDLAGEVFLTFDGVVGEPTGGGGIQDLFGRKVTALLAADPTRILSALSVQNG